MDINLDHLAFKWPKAILRFLLIGAFVYDPDGHNIEAVYYDYSKVEG